MSAAPLFPMFVKLAGRVCLAVGAGTVAESKIRGLVECGARVRVVAPEATVAVQDAVERGEVEWIRRAYEPGDLDGVFLVVAATSSVDVNHGVFLEAQRRGILCNVVDDPPHCDFFYPAVARRGQFQIAISTGGLSPALAQRVRKQMEESFPPVYAEWLEHLGKTRETLYRRSGDAELRRQLIHESVTAEAFALFQRQQEVEGRGSDPSGSAHQPGGGARLSTLEAGKELL